MQNRASASLLMAAVLGLASDSFAGGKVGDQAAEQSLRYAALIDGLASRNQAPDVVDGKPSFPGDFDWADQERVLTAFRKSGRDGEETLWEELLKHLDDERYSLTMEFNDSEIGRNYSVGSLCRMLAYKHLAEDVLDHYASVERPVRVIKELWPNLAQWRKAREGKSLYELQIEVCELGLKELPNLMQLRFLEERRRKRMQMQVESQIDDLKQSKKAAFFPLVLDSYAFYGKDKSHPLKATANPTSLNAK